VAGDRPLTRRLFGWLRPRDGALRQAHVTGGRRLRRALVEGDAAIAVGLLAALILVALALPLVLPDPNHCDFTAPAARDGGPPLPSWSHPFGLDAIHRDVLARFATGARVSLTVATGASLVATLIGTALGILSATLKRSRGASLDALIVRGIDGLIAVPFILFVAAVGVAVGHDDLRIISLVLGVTGVGGVARIVRAKALGIIDRDYVVAARALGASAGRIGWRHVLPNVTGTAAVLGANLVAAMILGEGTLSYLTVGVAPPRPSWGRMIHESEPFLSTRPLLAIAPALGIIVSMIAFGRLAEVLDRMITSSGGVRPRNRRLPVDLVLPLAVAAIPLALPRPTLEAPIAAKIEPKSRGGELHLATYDRVRTLDPALAIDEVSIAVSRHVFGRLFTWDLAGQIVPDLAERYAWSKDRTELSVELRPGIVFQDGSPLTATDVKRSLERALNPASACAEADLYSALVGFDQFRNGAATGIEGIAVASPHAVVFRLAQPSATFLPLLTLGFASPVCPSTSNVADPRAPDPACGAGLFRVDTFDPEDHVRLVRASSAPHDGPPYVDAIEWRFHVQPTSQRYRFERGELDWVRELGGADAAAYATDSRFAELRAWVAGTKTSGVFLNTEIPPFDRRDMRRAVALAIDASVLDGLRPDIRAVSQITPETLPGAPHMGTLHKANREEALRAMDDAGYPYDPTSGTGGYPEEIPYLTVPDSFEQFSAEVYKEQLAAIGIRIRLELKPFQAYRATVSRRGAARMGWASWGADFPDPSNFFKPMLVSGSIGDQSENLAFFSNAELDQLIERSELLQPGVERTQLFADAERIVANEAAWIPTVGGANLEVWQPRLVGYVPNPLAPLDFTHVRLLGEGP
jgi:ABC-type transport system substrate-binding protein/ABC-type dipeptide/oligopeptide/nickel transport system permease subunit